jgi:ABC-type transporter Mla subunit MlaD
MTQQKIATREAPNAREAAQAADLLRTVASTLNERLGVTAGELARSQDLLREASDELMTAFRGAADRIVAAQKTVSAATNEGAEFDLVLDHLYRAVQHIQSHDLVNQLIDAQKMRVCKMREKLEQALSIAHPELTNPPTPEQWIERSRAMLDCIVAGIAQIDEEARLPGSDKQRQGSVDLF